MTRLNSAFELGGVVFGETMPVVMPEIGSYFNDDEVLAERVISRLAEQGAPLIKGELFLSDDIVWDPTLSHSYQTASGTCTEPYKQIVARKVLTLGQWRVIAESCRKHGLATVVSVYDQQSLTAALESGADAIKIASNNLRHVPLIREAAAASAALFIDTGKANLSHIAEAVEVAAGSGCRNLVINHNPEGHPAPPEKHNLRMIETLSTAFGCPIGLSDHFVGEDMALAAAALGYSVIEKPFAFDLAAEDVDLPWALHVEAFETFQARVHAVHAALGVPRPPRNYSDADHPARMGIVTARRVAAGEKLGDDSIRYAWPLKGVPARCRDLIDGGTFRKAMGAGEPIDWADVNLPAS